MLKQRLIACLLWRDGMLIQSNNFKHTNSVGNAYTAVDFFNTWAIDEIILLNVTRNDASCRDFHRDLVHLSNRCFVPLSVGGWIRSLDDIRCLLQEGADKVVINTGGFVDHDLIRKGAAVFGNQCIVVSIDARRRDDGDHEVWINRGQDATGVSVLDWAREAQKLGAGEIFLTSIDNDGGRMGYDLDLVSKVARDLSIPVIASGGVGQWSHLVEGLEIGADAVSAANIFHFTEQSTKKAKDHLKMAGMNVREPEFYDIRIPRNPIYKI